ncbi:MAG: hypothetical protein PF549_05130 [Patescibacteria group bacterium]|jgi:hypothetical protein|nr:hypothetical protein [Patescibacteria group bacterium]
MDASIFLEEIRKFFILNFPDFIAVDPNNRTVRYLFYRNYRRFGLSIVVLTPVRLEGGEPKFIPASAMKITTELRITKTKRIVVALIGTEIHVGSDWERILKEKIETLVDLLKEIKQCDKCGDFLVPKTNKRKDSATWFVSLHCRRCSEYRSTAFGIGLKKRLHKHLHRKKT